MEVARTFSAASFCFAADTCSQPDPKLVLTRVSFLSWEKSLRDATCLDVTGIRCLLALPLPVPGKLHLEALTKRLHKWLKFGSSKSASIAHSGLPSLLHDDWRGQGGGSTVPDKLSTRIRGIALRAAWVQARLLAPKRLWNLLSNPQSHRLAAALRAAKPRLWPPLAVASRRI
jgi:hypothetical protein